MNKHPFVLFCAILVLLSPTFAQTGCGSTEKKSLATTATTASSLGTAPSERPTHRVVYTKASFGATITSSVLTIDDMPDHKLVQSFRIDAGRTTDPDFVITQEHAYIQGDERPGQTRYSGYATYLMQGGDKVFIRWESDKAPQAPSTGEQSPIESGTIVIIGGTGRYQKIQGRGVYRVYAKGPVVEENVLDINW
ncbi:MAG: hypothetical protein LAP85_26490 [Acidobacteriia bacterium]|nr:hypothetical protein [Terriglobia bacterium]